MTGLREVHTGIEMNTEMTKSHRERVCERGRYTYTHKLSLSLTFSLLDRCRERVGEKQCEMGRYTHTHVCSHTRVDMCTERVREKQSVRERF